MRPASLAQRKKKALAMAIQCIFDAKAGLRSLLAEMADMRPAMPKAYVDTRQVLMMATIRSKDLATS
jgi:hypothetical protein